MAYAITKTQYRDEWVVAFQRGETYLKDCVTKELMISGLTASFALQGAAGRMTRRGTNGLIPSRTGGRLAGLCHPQHAFGQSGLCQAGARLPVPKLDAGGDEPRLPQEDTTRTVARPWAEKLRTKAVAAVRLIASAPPNLTRRAQAFRPAMMQPAKKPGDPNDMAIGLKCRNGCRSASHQGDRNQCWKRLAIRRH
ncbi:hypothetical protein HNQ96_005483 [Aminobacter lissarensis]|uniref:Uncharacterized protein n=1 Tax=Aminobacter carboxidus TaxID=376165 RepID=A0A8E1WJF0_9HYPH|nr:hypothetical protein [Aminobacter lissarensis]MBB6469593.1 hypothetical protein [Aminobacter lissarensis]